jgi:hypothetical protein
MEMAIFRCVDRPWPSLPLRGGFVNFARGGRVDTAEAARVVGTSMEVVEATIRASAEFQAGRIVEVTAEGGQSEDRPTGDPQAPAAGAADPAEGGAASSPPSVTPEQDLSERLERKSRTRERRR